MFFSDFNPRAQRAKQTLAQKPISAQIYPAEFSVLGLKFARRFKFDGLLAEFK